MSDNQPYDDRHGYISAFKTPTEPAMPPHPLDKAREQRDADRQEERTQDRRAKALELAVLRANANEGTPPEEVFVAADQFRAYIETGERPA